MNRDLKDEELAMQRQRMHISGRENSKHKGTADETWDTE